EFGEIVYSFLNLFLLFADLIPLFPPALILVIVLVVVLIVLIELIGILLTGRSLGLRNGLGLGAGGLVPGFGLLHRFVHDGFDLVLGGFYRFVAQVHAVRIGHMFFVVLATWIPVEAVVALGPFVAAVVALIP